MKHGGLSRWGPLLAVLTLLVSAGVLVPLGAQATGERIWGYVWSDCGTANPVLVPSSVTLLDVHSGTTQSYPANSGYYEFVSPGTPPGYYKVKVDPTGFGYFSNETPPFRFDGLSYPREDVCVDRIPAKIHYLNLTILDAQPGRVTNERVTFQQSAHIPENATLTYNPAAGDNTITMSAFPLVNRSETITWFNNTGFTPVTGRTLTYGLHYIYDPTLAFQGKIRILDTTMQGELRNALFGVPFPVGWLKVTYQSVSTTSRLAHAQVTNEVWKKDTLVMPDPAGTLNFTRATGVVQIVGNWSFGDDVLDVAYDWSGAITTAHVTVRDVAHDEAIEPDLSTVSPPGVASAQVYDGRFNVTVTAPDYAPVPRQYTISGSDFPDTILMTRALTVTVLVFDAKGPVNSGITGLLINTNPGLDDHVRIMRSTSSPQGNILTIPAYVGTWLLIVDANGYKAGTRMLTLTGNATISDLYLTQSGEEKYQTGVVFPGNDWNNPVVWRNLTLLPDSELPAIGSENLRNLTWQVDFAFGTVKDGFLTALEKTALTSFLGKAGPFYTVTDNFLTVNGKTYRSSGVAADYTVSGAWSLQGGLSIVTSEKYALSDTSKPIPLNAARYYVNVTTAADKNVTVYQNNSVIVTLPHGYEMISKTSTGNVATRNFTAVTVDPGIDAVIPNPRVNMVVEKSVTGVARAEVEGPAGKVSVRQSDYAKGYKAWVANNTVIVFSANKTTDRQNQAINVKDANFTWTFWLRNMTLVNTSYGIWTKNNFTNVGGWYIVNLTVKQVNPDNRTYRDINVTVDNVAPIPWIRTNRTGNTLNPPTLSVKEDLSTRFFGNASADDLYTGSPDKGAVADWAWDFNGDGTIDRRGSVIDWNYSTPGTYNTTLIVTDSVGHKSRNQTMAVTVTDVTPPSVNYVVLDPANDYRETAQLIEGHGYIFNASKTTDNSLKHAWDNVNLTYTFQWGDGSTDGPSTGSNASLNRTHTYVKFSNGYKLNITAKDLAGNKGYLNRSIVVQANTTAHPDLSVITGTLKVDPGNPEESATVHFSLNFTNAKGKANATSLKVLLSMVVSGKDTNQTIADVRFTDANGNPLNAGNPLVAGKNGTVSFTWTAPTVGNKSLTIKVWDDDEPTTWVTAANQQTTSLVVKEAGWKLYAIVGGGIFIVFGLPILYYVIRKVRAGEWSLRRRKREEDEEDEEEEEDEDEEEERGGKKRL